MGRFKATANAFNTGGQNKSRQNHTFLKKKKNQLKKSKEKKSRPGDRTEIFHPPVSNKPFIKCAFPTPHFSSPFLQTLCSIFLHLSRKSLEIFGNEVICHPLTKKLKIAQKPT
jgi:hypothetical protein